MAELNETENSIRRILPHDNVAERSVIGSMLMDPDAISDVSGILVKEDFYNNEYGILYEAICSLHEEGKSVDEIILGERLHSMGAPESLYKMSYLGDILAGPQVSVFATDYAKIVRDKSFLRQMIRTSDQIAKECYEAQGKTDEIMDRAEESIFRLVQNKNGNRDFVPMQRIVADVIGEIEEAARKDGRINGLPTGFIDLDHKLTGLHKGELILVAARPAMGKTALVLNIAKHVVKDEKVPTVIFSLEMSKESLVSRIIAMDALVDAQALRTGNLTDDDWDRIITSTEQIARTPLYIDDNSSITISELRSKCRKLKQTEDIGLVIVDYLQLMNASRPVESRQQFISEVSRALKGLARELGVPVIALSQLNRAVDSRPDHKPVLADLRESGAIEQDADVVMFIYRDDYYNPETERPGIAEIIVAKQRNGSTGPVDLVWQGKYTRFANCEH
ncbi:MAG: replicative DNA helicase [Eubacterium sp.]|nr:replicative DNA helicase [Eubacterium sp.]